MERRGNCSFICGWEFMNIAVQQVFFILETIMHYFEIKILHFLGTFRRQAERNHKCIQARVGVAKRERKTFCFLRRFLHLKE